MLVKLMSQWAVIGHEHLISHTHLLTHTCARHGRTAPIQWQCKEWGIWQTVGGEVGCFPAAFTSNVRSAWGVRQINPLYLMNSFFLKQTQAHLRFALQIYHFTSPNNKLGSQYSSVAILICSSFLPFCILPGPLNYSHIKSQENSNDCFCVCVLGDLPIYPFPIRSHLVIKLLSSRGAHCQHAGLWNGCTGNFWLITEKRKK